MIEIPCKGECADTYPPGPARKKRWGIIRGVGRDEEVSSKRKDKEGWVVTV
jgi:hypothetical protein